MNPSLKTLHDGDWWALPEFYCSNQSTFRKLLIGCSFSVLPDFFKCSGHFFSFFFHGVKTLYIFEINHLMDQHDVPSSLGAVNKFVPDLLRRGGKSNPIDWNSINGSATPFFSHQRRRQTKGSKRSGQSVSTTVGRRRRHKRRRKRSEFSISPRWLHFTGFFPRKRSKKGPTKQRARWEKRTTWRPTSERHRWATVRWGSLCSAPDLNPFIGNHSSQSSYTVSYTSLQWLSYPPRQPEWWHLNGISNSSFLLIKLFSS